MAIDPQTGMLYFYCAEPQQIKSIPREGVSSSGAPLRLLGSLEDAEAECTGSILVIDAMKLNGAPGRVDHIPSDAVMNLDPYAPPAPVAAAGGFIMRGAGDRLELLMIYRRGRWDLPKGKLDPGETIEECALREVREELGIEAVELGRPLGTTVHGYREGKQFMVKTTHWYAMSTDEESFRPQTDEDIEEVRWMSWHEAHRRVGFDTLRRHMDQIRP